MVDTDVMLMNIHRELLSELRSIPGKPLLITVSHKDETTGELQHWIGQNNDFVYEDMVITGKHLLVQIEKDLKPEPSPAVLRIQQQVKRRTMNAGRKAVLRGK